MAGKTHLQRIFIAAAGPAINYILAFVLLVGLFVTMGKPYHAPIVGDVLPTSPAYVAGIQKGDRFERVKGKEVKTFEDVLKILRKTPATEPLDILIVRDPQAHRTITIPPIKKATGVWFGKLKCAPDKTSRFYEKKSWKSAISDVLDMMNPVRMLQTLKLDSMGGPISIAHQAGHVFQEGVVPVLFLMASLSLGLGFFNLLPLPVLDGGVIMMEGIECLMGRKLSDRVRQGVSLAAFGMIAVLFVVLSWSDLKKIPAVASFLSR